VIFKRLSFRFYWHWGNYRRTRQFRSDSFAFVRFVSPRPLCAWDDGCNY